MFFISCVLYTIYFRENKTLVELNIGGNKIGKAGAVAIGNVIRYIV
jgi:hypothetical protein